jgi:hypothetical protein
MNKVLAAQNRYCIIKYLKSYDKSTSNSVIMRGIVHDYSNGMCIVAAVIDFGFGSQPLRDSNTGEQIMHTVPLDDIVEAK